MSTVESSKGIYGTGDYSGYCSPKRKLSKDAVKLISLKNECLVSCEGKEDEKKFVISAKMVNRYSFKDKLQLLVYLECDGKSLKEETLDIEKRPDEQLFEIQYEDNEGPPFSMVEVHAGLYTEEITYYVTNWATEINFEYSGRSHDVVLIVGESKFYVHKIYLATWSKYFDRLFFGDFKEKDQKEIKLEEVDAEEFNLILRLIHPHTEQSVGERNVLKVLKLADRFEIPTLMVRCGVFLSSLENCKQLTLMDRLELGDKHSLGHLQVACFERIHNMAAQERINFFDLNRDRIKELSDMSVKNLI